MRRLKISILALAATLAAGPALATTVADPAGDFLATYSGPLAEDLDILSASAFFAGDNLHLSATLGGAVGTTPGALYVWGIDRGGGAARLALGSPAVGSTVLWDAVAVLFPNGVARVVTFPTAGPPAITPLAGSVTIDGDTISSVIPLSLLPSRGFDRLDYTFTLWSRRRVDPAVDGTNAEIADFAPDLAGLHASVPEPAAWSTMILGLGLVGAAVRARGRRAPA